MFETGGIGQTLSSLERYLVTTSCPEMHGDEKSYTIAIFIGHVYESRGSWMIRNRSG